MPKAANAWLSKVQVTGQAGGIALQRPFNRLLTRAQFQAVLAGTTVAKSPHFALHSQSLSMTQADRPKTSPADPAPAESRSESQGPLRSPVRPLFAQPGPWLGAMVPKRWAKRAVTRNTIKRQIYAVCSDFSPQDEQAAFVVRLRRDFSKQAFHSASSDLLKQAVRAELQTLFDIGERHA